jgi:hypothetical protein
MKFPYKLLIVVLASFAFVLNSCKEDCPCVDETNPECDNYDPCWDKKPVTADFYMYENHEGLDTSKGWEYYDTDTLLGQSVLLVAKEERELYWSEVTYTWIIGAETITGKDKKVITRNTFPSNTQIPVTLIVSKKPHLDCFPEDDGIDTVTRYMVFPSNADVVPKWQGEYIGYTTDKPDEILQLGLYRSDTTAGSTSRYPRLSGLPNSDCQWQLLDYSTFGYKQFQIEDNGNFSCKSIKGLFRTFGNDSLVAKYSEMVRPNVGSYGDRVNKVFIGKRLK